MSLTIDLTDRVAVVSGGGAGLGRAAAVALARCGADVVVVDIAPALAQRTAELVAATGRRGIAVPADAMDPEQVRAAVARAGVEFGRLDVLVNNAGGTASRRFTEQSERSWRRHLELNLLSAMTATSAAVPLMRASGRGGAIVNIATIEASRAAPTFAAYAAAKAGLVSFGETMAVELSADGIRVNTVAPDLIATPGLRGLRGDDLPDDAPPRPAAEHEAVRRYVPLGREGRPEECGDLVAFLASDRASYITGVTVPIDGGTAAASGWVRSADHTTWELGPLPVAPQPGAGAPR